MHTVRRLYLYVLSGISLAVLLVGVNLLLTVLLDVLGLGRGPFVGGSPTVDREQISLAAALTVVGLLVWGVHWWFVERSLRGETESAAAERGSTLRALYLTVVLAFLLGFGSVAGLTLLRALFASVLQAGSTDADLAGATATLLVTAGAWLYHVWVRRRDLATPVEGGAAWLPRVYVYGAALVALILLSLGIGRLLGVALNELIGPAPLFDDFGPAAVAGELAAIVVWSVVWLGHWWYASRLAAEPDWRGASERPSRLRLAYYVAVIAASAVAMLWFGSEAVRAALVPLLGAQDAAGVPADTSMAAAIMAPLLSALPWAVAWWIHRGWMRAESLEHDGLGRVATADRLDAGSVTLAGLGFAAVGAAWLLGIVIDLALGGNRASGGDFWRLELAQYMSLGVAGVVPWIWNWGRLQRRSAADPAGEANSPVRRSVLLIVLGVAVLTTLGSLAFVLYRLFGTLLGVGFGGNAVSALSTPLGALIVAAGVAAYHGVVLRRDQRLRAESQPAAAPAEAAAPARAAAARRVMVLTGPDGADLDVAVLALRSHLPPGYGLELAEGAD